MLLIKELKKVRPEQLLYRFRAARFRGAGANCQTAFPAFFFSHPSIPLP